MAYTHAAGYSACRCHCCPLGAAVVDRDDDDRYHPGDTFANPDPYGWRVYIPPEFEVLATVFVFASLFLGEVRGYYIRFLWWDIVLHTASGFLLGIVGFLLVYVLYEKEEIDLHMTPGFVSFFAFMFALGMGALWAIFEFRMDSYLGLNMQKAMLGDPSGLTDTM